MAQFELTVATRGNHATLLPVVLIATSINEARPTPVININYEDTARLNEGENAVIGLNTVSKSVFGTVNIIQELCAHFPFLADKDTKLVCYPAIFSFLWESQVSDRWHPRRRTSGSLSWIPCLPWTSKLLTLSFSASTHTFSCARSLSDTLSLPRILLCGVPSVATVSLLLP